MRTVCLIVLLGAGGCYLKPTRTNNPLHSREGVRLRLVGLDCEDHRGTDSDPVSRDLAVRLEVANPTGQPLDFAPEAVELTAGDEPVPAAGGGFERVPPGQTQVFTLRFVHHAYCDRDFALGFDHAMKLAGQPVAVAVLHFTP